MKILLRGAGPELPLVGFAPDLPVLHASAPAESVGPTPGVVFGDPAADLGPLFIILRRVGEVAPGRVFDGFPQPVFHRHPRFDAGAQVVVGLVEIVVGGIGRVGVEVGEDLMHVHEAHAGIVEGHVVEPDGLDVQFAVEVPAPLPGEDVVHGRREGDAVHGFETACHPGKIDFHHFRLSVRCTVFDAPEEYSTFFSVCQGEAGGKPFREVRSGPGRRRKALRHRTARSRFHPSSRRRWRNS